MSIDFTEVETSRGTFIGWGAVGQTVTIDVVSYSPDGGTDFNDKPCPQLVGVLVGSADSYRDKGSTKETLDDGEFVTITCGQANLRNKVISSGVQQGDMLRITYEGDEKVDKGTMKVFRLAIAKGAGTGGAGKTAPAKDEPGDLI